MGRKRTYKILLSDGDKKSLMPKSKIKKHAKLLYAAALSCLTWMKMPHSSLHMHRLQNLTGLARQLYPMLFLPMHQVG